MCSIWRPVCCNSGSNLADPYHLPAGPEAPYQAAAERMAREFAQRAPGGRAAVQAAMHEVLLYLVRYHGSRFAPIERLASRRNLLKLQPAMELIERRLEDPQLNVGEVAASIAVSEVYLRRLFRQVAGASPTAFVQRRRVERACRLLQDTDEVLPAIAVQCGFASLPYFYFQALDGHNAGAVPPGPVWGGGGVGMTESVSGRITAFSALCPG